MNPPVWPSWPWFTQHELTRLIHAEAGVGASLLFGAEGQSIVRMTTLFIHSSAGRHLGFCTFWWNNERCRCERSHTSFCLGESGVGLLDPTRGASVSNLCRNRALRAQGGLCSTHIPSGARGAPGAGRRARGGAGAEEESGAREAAGAGRMDQPRPSIQASGLERWKGAGEPGHGTGPGAGDRRRPRRLTRAHFRTGDAISQLVFFAERDLDECNGPLCRRPSPNLPVPGAGAALGLPGALPMAQGGEAIEVQVGGLLGAPPVLLSAASL